MTIATLPSKAERLVKRASQFTRLDRKKTVVLFAGSGGSCSGIEEAYCAAGLDQGVDLAVNHDPDAIACHEANHPLTEHLQCDVFEVDPETVEGPIGMLWGSPDCTDFSKAKGGKPIRTTQRRSLAWVLIHWAFVKQPDVIMLENVEEFEQWDLLDDEGRPLRGGATFDIWVNCLRYLGYRVEWRRLRACDYGTPTTRNRLFVIARRDGKPIVWPKPTHGPKGSGLKPYVPASDCIDFTRPMCSIFATPDEAKRWAQAHGLPTPKRPLATNTERRIAAGIRKHVLEAAEPFIVSIANYGRGMQARSAREPLSTVTANPKGGHHALVAPTLVQVGYGERQGQRPRALDIRQPLGTVVGGGCKHALVAAFLSKNYTGVVGQPLDKPIGTITSVDHHSLCAVHIEKMKGTARHGQPVNQPLDTVQAGGNHYALVAAFLAKYYGADQHGQPISDPLHTLPTVERFGLVTVAIDGETWAIVDILMRMLTPRELALCQGFRPDYVIDRGADGRVLSKRTQVRLIGNSVCRHPARALVTANVVDMDVLWRAAA